MASVRKFQKRALLHYYENMKWKCIAKQLHEMGY